LSKRQQEITNPSIEISCLSQLIFSSSSSSSLIVVAAGFLSTLYLSNHQNQRHQTANEGGGRLVGILLNTQIFQAQRLKAEKLFQLKFGCKKERNFLHPHVINLEWPASNIPLSLSCVCVCVVLNKNAMINSSWWRPKRRRRLSFKWKYYQWRFY